MTALSVRRLSNPFVLFATGFGSGFSPIAPGTVGSVVVLPAWWFVLGTWSVATQAAAVVVLFVAGTWVVRRVCDSEGVHDDAAIVIDEIVGMWITLLFAPRTLWALVVGFALFRLFDIAKPWPVSWADSNVPGALGIMLDDVIAGVLAAAVLYIILAVIGVPAGFG